MRRKDLLGCLATGVAVAATATVVEAAVENRGVALHPPERGAVNVALVFGPDLVTIDLFGPAAVFENANYYGGKMVDRFNVYTVGPTVHPIDIDFGTMTANYSFDNAPQPHVLVVPQQKALPETVAFIKRASRRTDLTMSVCTGAFLVAKAGLFDGGRATTHHDAYERFAQEFPNVELVRGVRYVEEPNVSSAGGETCGIELGLRVVERYYGREAANVAAYNMEYRRSARPLGVTDVG